MNMIYSISLIFYTSRIVMSLRYQEQSHLSCHSIVTIVYDISKAPSHPAAAGTVSFIHSSIHYS